MKCYKKAISLVLAPVIIVALAITLTIVTSFFLAGITSSSTPYESIEIINSYCTYSISDDEWTVELTLKNTGTKTALLVEALINGFEIDQYNVSSPAPDGQAVSDISSTLIIRSGESATVRIFIDGPCGGLGWRTVTSGTSIEISLQSAGGVDYYELVTLT